MARFLAPARARKTLALLRTVALSPALARRSYISDMRRSAFRENILRLLRSEIDYAASDLRRLPLTFSSFAVDERPGEQLIRLTRSHGFETVKVEATMVDGAAPSTRSPTADSDSPERYHISLLVEVAKREDPDFVLQCVCSAWPDALDVEKVFTVRKGAGALEPSMGPDFGDMSEEMQNAVSEYLEERGVNEELAEFLHGYAETKDRGELVRWLKNVEGCVKK